MKAHIGVFALLLACTTVFGCHSNRGPTGDEIGSIAAPLNSPTDGCLEITSRSSLRTETETFLVTKGVETEIVIDDLPLTRQLIGGKLFNNATCTGTPLFVAKDVEVDLSPQNPNGRVTLAFLGNANVVIDSTFENGCASRSQVANLSASSRHGMTYFARTKETLLVRAEGESMQLYAFDYPTRIWSHVDVVGALPPARSDAVFQYDSATQNAVLFGGENGVLMNDVWEFDGCAWKNRTPSVLPANWPSPRWASAGAFEQATRRVLITTGIVIPMSTWMWETGVADATVFEWHSDRGTFSVIPPSGTPPTNRGGATVVGDAIRGGIYLTSGIQAGYAEDNAWYRFDSVAGTWSQVSIAAPPRVRSFAGAYHDLANDRITLTGGQWIGWIQANELNRYDPLTGTMSTLGPDPSYNRFWAPIAFDTDNMVGIQFSGYVADVEVYGPNGPAPAPAETRIFGSNGAVTTIVAP